MVALRDPRNYVIPAGNIDVAGPAATIAQTILANRQLQQNADQFDKALAADAQNRSDDFALRGQKLDNTYDINQGNLALRGKTLDANTEIANRRVDIESKKQQAEQALTEAEARFQDARTAGKQVEISAASDRRDEAQQNYARYAREADNAQSDTAALKFASYANTNFAGGDAALLADPAGRRALANTVSEIVNQHTLAALAGANGDGKQLQLVANRDGTGFAIATMDGEVKGTMTNAEALAEVKQRAGLTAAAYAGETDVPLAGISTAGERLQPGAPLVRSLEAIEQQRRLASAAADARANSQAVLGFSGGATPSAQAPNSGANIGKTLPPVATTTRSRAEADNVTEHQRDVAISTAAREVGSLANVSGGTAGVAGSLTDNNYEVFAAKPREGQSKEDAVGERMHAYVQQALGTSGGAIAKVLGFQPRVKSWSQDQLRRATTLILKTQEKTTRSPNWVFDWNNDLSADDAIPLPTLRQLQEANRDISGQE